MRCESTGPTCTVRLATNTKIYIYIYVSISLSLYIYIYICTYIPTDTAKRAIAEYKCYERAALRAKLVHG